MELFQPSSLIGAASLNTPAASFVARYSAVFWEPVAGTGERIVALIAVQPHEMTTQAVSAATYPVINPVRLRQLLGRQRGSAAVGVLEQCAQYMTARQQAGLPLEELRPLFRGMEIGPPMTARAWSIQQLLDAAVRSVSAFGSADEMIAEEEERGQPRHVARTAEFLRQLRRIVAADDKAIERRFDVPLSGIPGVPEVTVDYAHGPLVVQVSSLPATPKQAERTEVEVQAKLFELDVARSQMQGNPVRPALLFNTEALASDTGEDAQRLAQAALERLSAFARHKSVSILQAESPMRAASLLT